ncbi:MAG: hypothetical protein EBZ77_03580 [Chitinophagia bacterium]|nr:hypothetical protein [Chitinophagia bacterium]
MPIIQATLRDSGGALLTAKLRTTIDSPINVTSTSPHTTYMPVANTITITNGALSVNLAESATSNTTYRFELFTESTIYNYFFLDGTSYNGPVHLHTDNKYYTGELHSTDSEELTRNSSIQESEIADFRAIVPNVNTINWSELVPTGITTDVLDTSVRRIAAILATDSTYAAALRGGPVWQGNWSVVATYTYNDAVFYTDNSRSYVYINNNPSAGNLPTNTTFWQRIT